MARCPSCSGESSRAVDPKGAVMTFAKDRECMSCGTVWRPPCPVCAAWVSALVGAGLLGFAAWGVLVSWDTPSGVARYLPQLVIAVVVGVICIGYGLAVLQGRAGKLQLIRGPTTGGREQEG
jgi:hypothetical protein